ncbi:TOTE conflict system archaeo-eukaryotic primase domain-containing protein [Halalkalibacter flavus]|uniref:TOTE conflict system archaeo-eukaryotic primase domain-containing protein n=1 Tax=Halalkalibacter flavus TaxID=3090668 RepID=UPI002FCB03EC
MEIQEKLQQALAECERLRKENEHLKLQLAKVSATQLPYQTSGVNLHSSPSEKVLLYMSLFQGRQDVFAKRWEAKDGRSGYSPVCVNEWDPIVCKKPKIKCQDCQHRSFAALSKQAIYDHLSGKITAGIYPMQTDDMCSFLAIDFDKRGWEEDVKAVCQACKTYNLPYHIERSRSGNGAHIWFFFQQEIKARSARKLGMMLLSKARENRLEIGMDSYDRMFPNQDTLPAGGFGNLIALPLQKLAREQGNSVFIDENFQPFGDQWHYLSSIKKISRETIEGIIRESEKHLTTPSDLTLAPKSISVELKNGIHIQTSGVPGSLLNKFMQVATFGNPEFYKAQAKRYSTYRIPRIVDCSTLTDDTLILPRGNLDDIVKIAKENGVFINFLDKRNTGHPLKVTFHGELMASQEEAVTTLQNHDHGVLQADTGFGKTVAASALIAKNEVNTLVIVHRTQLIDQWKEQLSKFLNLPVKEIGQIGGGKHKATYNIDVATIQSLHHKGQLKPEITKYGQIIVDECHHISAIVLNKY